MNTKTMINSMALGAASVAGAFVIATTSPSWAIPVLSNTAVVRTATATPNQVTDVRYYYRHGYYRGGYYRRGYYGGGYYNPGAAVATGLALGLLGAAAAPYMCHTITGRPHTTRHTATTVTLPIEIVRVTQWMAVALGRREQVNLGFDHDGCAQDRTSGPQRRYGQRHRRFFDDAVISRFSRPDLPYRR